MTIKYVKGDYNQKHCEIKIDDGFGDEFEFELFGDVKTDDADKFLDLLNGYENQIATFKSGAEVQKATIQRLQEENQKLKKYVKELYDMVKVDVYDEIEVYPKTLMEYILNILKIISD